MRVKRSEEKASRTLFITKVGKRGIFLTCYDGNICSFPRPKGERKMPALGGPSINYSSTLVGSCICRPPDFPNCCFLLSRGQQTRAGRGRGDRALVFGPGVLGKRGDTTAQNTSAGTASVVLVTSSGGRCPDMNPGPRNIKPWSKVSYTQLLGL